MFKHTPWSDVIDLLTFDPAQDGEGYVQGFDPQDEQTLSTQTIEAETSEPQTNPSRRTVYCTFEDGVSQSEFYNSMKAGLQATAQATLWSVDYGGEKFCDFQGRFFKVIRAFQSSFDHKTLILSEVVR